MFQKPVLGYKGEETLLGTRQQLFLLQRGLQSRGKLHRLQAPEAQQFNEIFPTKEAEWRARVTSVSGQQGRDHHPRLPAAGWSSQMCYCKMAIL